MSEISFSYFHAWFLLGLGLLQALIEPGRMDLVLVTVGCRVNAQNQSSIYYVISGNTTFLTGIFFFYLWKGKRSNRSRAAVTLFNCLDFSEVKKGSWLLTVLLLFYFWTPTYHYVEFIPRGQQYCHLTLNIWYIARRPEDHKPTIPWFNEVFSFFLRNMEFGSNGFLAGKHSITMSKGIYYRKYFWMVRGMTNDQHSEVKRT